VIRWFVNLIYGALPAEFESAYGLQESVERLRAATKRSAFSALSAQAAVGKVTESTVRLQRVIPMVGNSFKPWFYGTFVMRGERVLLTGQFKMLLAARIFMTLWFGFQGLMLIFAVASLPAPSHGATKVPFLVTALAMFAVGIALLRLGKWFSRNDVSWLSAVIQRAIGDHSANLQFETAEGSKAPAVPSRGTPTVLKFTAAVLALMGAINLFGGIANLMPNLAGPMNDAPGQLPYRLIGEAGTTMGACLLALAAGVYLRSKLAWRAAFVFIAIAWIWSAAGLWWLPGREGPPVIIDVIFIVFGAVVVAYWGRWWYGLRVHFESS